jgi:hypothetical protein
VSSILDSLSSSKGSPGGKAGACSKGVSIGERNASGGFVRDDDQIT